MRTKKEKRIALLTLSFFIFVCIYLFFHKTPKDFPLGQVVSINSGESLQSITDILHDAHIIKSPFTFRAHVILLGGEKRVIAGDYLLDKREGPADLAYRLVNGKFHLNETKITIPEGWNIFQIGDYLDKNLIDFNKSQFLTLAKNKEGYLFPETYFVSPTAKPDTIINRMNQTFEEKILTVSGIATSSHKLKDIIIMASILENEARTKESRRIVAGILWKRLALGMPLQVDATFSYINGKTSDELTLADLQIDSPYNTYLYKGLPPGPISNPGIEAMNDAVSPIITKYLYFLSSKDGETIHYARTFEEHIANKKKYLK